MPFDRQIFFDAIRPTFGGKLSQSQVDGMEAVLDAWEARAQPGADLRHLAYPFATDKWETSSTMLPIEEYGKGAGQPYGKPDPKTGQTYYGRGYVQLTWAENYLKADTELGLKDDDSCYWQAKNALDPVIAAEIMFQGMDEGWFRKGKDGGPETLTRYFNEATDNPVGARNIINGDGSYHKDWMPAGMTVGQYIANDHRAFLSALELAWVEEEIVIPVPPPENVVTVAIVAPPGIRVDVTIAESSDAEQDREAGKGDGGRVQVAGGGKEDRHSAKGRSRIPHRR